MPDSDGKTDGTAAAGTAAPTVSVVMAVYNGEVYLRAAVDSILAQTFSDFELIVVDDGSTDSTAEILAGYGDPRLRVLRNGANLGLPRTLNRGLDAARGTYLARMDADDIALPERFARQVAFLDSHPDHVLVATSVYEIDAEGRQTGVLHMEAEDLELRWEAFFYPPFRHPTVMFRRAAEGGRPLPYTPEFFLAEDYDYWIRIAEHGKVAVLPDILLRYRIHGGGLTIAKFDKMKTYHYKVAEAHLRRRFPGIEPAIPGLLRACAVYSVHRRADPDDVVPVWTGNLALARALARDIGLDAAARRRLGRFMARLYLRRMLGGNRRRPAMLAALAVQGWRFAGPFLFGTLPR